MAHVPGDWMYFAPEKAAAPQVEYRPSNLLADEDPEYDEPRRQYFKETDTAYIRMAKEGGRKDLLMPKPQLAFHPSTQAVPYNRCEWFYLEDVAAQDAAEQAKQPPNSQQHVARIPDYMVHDPAIWAEMHSNDAQPDQSKKNRVPYATWSEAQMEKQDLKTQQSSAKQRTGQSRVASTSNSKTSAATRKPIVPKAELQSPAGRFVPVKTTAERDANMSKLLANEYVEEFDKQRSDWQKRQAEADQRRASNPNANKAPSAKLTTEYRAKVGKPRK